MPVLPAEPHKSGLIGSMFKNMTRLRLSYFKPYGYLFDGPGHG